MGIILKTFLSVCLVSLIALLGIFIIFIKENILKRILIILIAFAVGGLLGDVFLHIIPQIYATAGGGEDHHVHNIYDSMPAVLILAGILVFFLLEKVLRWRHCHHLPDHKKHEHPVAIINLIGDAVHNFLDGVLIAGSFLVSPIIGLSTTLAVIFHEIPQEIGDFATLLHAGFSKHKAIITNFISALTAFLGAFLVFLVGFNAFAVKRFLLPLTAGGFIYIAAADLIPILHKKNKPLVSLFQTIAILFGILVMFLVSFLE